MYAVRLYGKNCNQNHRGMLKSQCHRIQYQHDRIWIFSPGPVREERERKIDTRGESVFSQKRYLDPLAFLRCLLRGRDRHAGGHTGRDDRDHCGGCRSSHRPRDALSHVDTTHDWRGTIGIIRRGFPFQIARTTAAAADGDGGVDHRLDGNPRCIVIGRQWGRRRHPTARGMGAGGRGRGRRRCAGIIPVRRTDPPGDCCCFPPAHLTGGRGRVLPTTAINIHRLWRVAVCRWNGDGVIEAVGGIIRGHSGYRRSRGRHAQTPVPSSLAHRGGCRAVDVDSPR